ncbi:MAG: sulfotransferase [Candidatus Sulfotelmatobacter sp.]
MKFSHAKSAAYFAGPSSNQQTKTIKRTGQSGTQSDVIVGVPTQEKGIRPGSGRRVHNRRRLGIVLEWQRRKSDLEVLSHVPSHDCPSHDPRYPGVLAELALEDFSRLGESYITDTRAYRRDKSKPFFIDKMPNNFRHIGLIHLMMPHAKIIDVRREPMACCFSNLKQLFAKGQEFTYGIEDIARYYRTYLDLMRHWDAVLPGRVLRVLYEDVVEDLEANVRRILKFCCLEFEPACVEFYKTERGICTASSEQVRQPIFREGLLQWRNYEPWLGPLKDALGDALIRYRE